MYCWLNEAFRHKTNTILKCFVPSVCWAFFTGRHISSHIPSVSERIKNGRTGRKQGSHLTNGHHQNSGDKSDSFSSNSTVTGKQQAISELISMSALIEQDLLESSTRYSNTNASNRNFGYSKEQRLALMTTQSGRRRHHSHQLIMMLKMNEDEPVTKTTSINLVSSPSSSSIEMELTKHISTEQDQTSSANNNLN